MKRFPRACRQRYRDGRRDTLYVRLPDDQGTMKRVNLGPYDDPTSWQKYHKLKADWERGRGIDLTKPISPAPPDGLLVVELFELFLIAHAQTYRRDPNSKNRSTTLTKFKTALGALGEIANLPAATITAKMIRQWMYRRVEEGRLARTTINAYLHCLQSVYRWGELEDKVPEQTNAVIQSVKGLKRSEGGVKETKIRQPVDFGLVEATLPYLHDTPATIVRLLMLTGARPSEICGLSLADIHKDEKNGVWVYQPPEHKTAHRGLPRTIVFGAEAIDLLTTYMQKHRIKSGRVFRVEDKRAKTIHYSQLLLRHRIGIATREGGLTYWTPYQIRHTVASKLEAELGIDAARAVLGHSSSLTTSGYIHRDLSTVIALAKRGGIGQ